MDYSKETFPLNHFALFCKGWYQPTNEKEDLFDFLRKLLYLDGYEFAKTKEDIISIILARYSEYNEWLKVNGKNYKSIYDFNDNILKLRGLNGISYEEAIVKTIQSIIMCKEDSEIELNPPHFGKKLYKAGIRFNQLFRHNYQGMTYKQQNQIVREIFKNSKAE